MRSVQSRTEHFCSVVIDEGVYEYVEYRSWGTEDSNNWGKGRLRLSCLHNHKYTAKPLEVALYREPEVRALLPGIGTCSRA